MSIYPLRIKQKKESVDKICAFGSVLSFLFPTKLNQDSEASFENYFDELDIDGFDFSSVLRIENVPKVESKNILNNNVFKMGFSKQTNYPELLPLYVSQQFIKRPRSKDKTLDLLWFSGQYSIEKNKCSLS